MGKRGMWGAELGRSGDGAATAKVLEQMKQRVLTQQSLALLLPFHPHGCSLERRRALPLCTLYKPECFLLQIFNAWILNSF